MKNPWIIIYHNLSSFIIIYPCNPIPLIVDFPINNGGSFHSHVTVYQRVIRVIHGSTRHRDSRNQMGLSAEQAVARRHTAAEAMTRHTTLRTVLESQPKPGDMSGPT